MSDKHISENLAASTPGSSYGSASVGTSVTKLIDGLNTPLGARWIRIVNESPSAKICIKTVQVGDAAPAISTTIGNADYGTVILPEGELQVLYTAGTEVYVIAAAASTPVSYTAFKS